jgi:hypothetical protein
MRNQCTIYLSPQDILIRLAPALTDITNTVGEFFMFDGAEKDGDPTTGDSFCVCKKDSQVRISLSLSVLNEFATYRIHVKASLDSKSDPYHISTNRRGKCRSHGGKGNKGCYDC